MLCCAVLTSRGACQEEPHQEAKRNGGPSKQALLDTIQGLQKALQRSRKECEAAVSSAKYMQVRSPVVDLG